MLSPRVGGQTQGIFTFSWKPESNSPPQGTQGMSNSHPWGILFCLSNQIPTKGQHSTVKIPTQGKAGWVNFPWVAPPPPWGKTLLGALFTLGARVFSCLVSGVGHVSADEVKRNTPSAEREKKPLVPRVRVMWVYYCPRARCVKTMVASNSIQELTWSWCFDKRRKESIKK